MTTPDAERLRRSLAAGTRNRAERIDAFASIDSTNCWLKQQKPPRPGKASVAIAGHQTAGRGRQSRRWVSAPGCSLCLSLAYTFEESPDPLPPLTLAIGVAAAAALGGLGVDEVRLKWPNDLLLEGRKLGGILVESRVRSSDAGQATSVIAGIGINLSVPDDVADAVDSGWTGTPIGLDECGVDLPERDELAAKLVDAIVDAMARYDAHGFAPFEAPFATNDWLAGKAIAVETPDGERAGLAAGIDGDGALLLKRNGRVERIVSGSIRLDDREPREQRAV